MLLNKTIILVTFIFFPLVSWSESPQSTTLQSVDSAATVRPSSENVRSLVQLDLNSQVKRLNDRQNPDQVQLSVLRASLESMVDRSWNWGVQLESDLDSQNEHPIIVSEATVQWGVARWLSWQLGRFALPLGPTNLLGEEFFLQKPRFQCVLFTCANLVDDGLQFRVEVFGIGISSGLFRGADVYHPSGVAGTSDVLPHFIKLDSEHRQIQFAITYFSEKLAGRARRNLFGGSIFSNHEFGILALETWKEYRGQTIGSHQESVAGLVSGSLKVFKKFEMGLRWDIYKIQNIKNSTGNVLDHQESTWTAHTAWRANSQISIRSEYFSRRETLGSHSEEVDRGLLLRVRLSANQSL